MYAKISANVKRFLILVLLQVMILNHVQWIHFINPYVYILFILLLPIETPVWLVMLLGLATGLIVDMFGNSGGIHAAATVLIAYLRPAVLRLLSPREEYDTEMTLTPQRMGLKWFITYASIMTLLHHFAFFYLEAFRFSEFFITFFKVILNTIVTVLIILLGTYLFGKKQKHERFVR